MKSSLESKTVRPGLNAYSFYHSDRHPSNTYKPQPIARTSFTKIWLIALIVLALGGGVFAFQGRQDKQPVASTKVAATIPVKPNKVAATTPAPVAVNHCAGNTLPKFISVDVSDRHLWACQGETMAYDSPVITGMEQHASTLTPPGTYKIYSKVKDITLVGQDETGSWKDPVSYWMPFLSDQYGIYGFHDAMWRDNSAFGNIDPNSSDASHGCVELPLATSAWLYGWAEVGTTLTIQA